jgi:anti-sigma regulatory factor (Ser/Thr protein kinase)
MKDSRTERELGSIEAEASMDQWETFIDFATEHISRWVDDKSRSYKLRLAFEELVSNIIRAAGSCREANSTPVLLEISALERIDNNTGWFVLRTSDSGVQFDPQFESRAPVDTAQHVSERAIGGLGLFLIMQSVDRVNYQWKSGRNVYELSTQLAAESSQPEQGSTG